MKTELKEVSATHKELTIEIDGAAIKDAYGRVSQKFAKRANVPGFRKGNAPVDVVRLHFREEIKSDVLQEIIPGIVANAIKEYALQPLAEPHLHLDDHENLVVNGSRPISLHVHVEVMPEIPTPKFDGIEVIRRVKPVEEGEIDDLIAERLQREAAFVPVDGRASKVGDTVIVDLEGKFDDQPDADPIIANDLEIALGDEVIEQSFTDNLIGVTEDEEKEFTVAYPETFSSAALAGKTVHYRAKVKSVGSAVVPELDDNWAKSLDEGYTSLADLKQQLRADLETMAEADADARVRNNAIAKLIEENPFEVPNTLIENQTRSLLNNFLRDLQQRGVDPNKIESEFVQMAYVNLRSQAERDVSGALLLDRVAELEKIEVPKDEVDAEIAKIAEYYKSTRDEVRKSLEKQDGGVANIENNLKTRRSIEAVVAKIKVSEGEWVDESLGNPVAAVEEKKAPKKKAVAKKTAKK